jgi:hypothetical protein
VSGTDQLLVIIFVSTVIFFLGLAFLVLKFGKK